ncbi:MAG: ABC transporter substrate-binding protein [Dehalococcoidia bacterium]|nr:ABC transporter substrate-binding protein [Dehalococcoidia bacterium]
MSGFPRRVVCLTAETTEIAFALGCAERVAGVSGYAVRPPEARRKPKVAAFQTAHVDRIMALEPDLVLGFSDLQAEIAAELIRRGATVLVTNQRSLVETSDAIRLVAAALGAAEAGERLVARFEAELATIFASNADLPRRPRVYFEEWDEPLISGIAWVSEIVERCGGDDVFGELRTAGRAARRIVEASEVVRRDPEVIVASWCGKKARLEKIAARPGWADVAAVRSGRISEIKAPDILQPGPSLVHGSRLIAAAVREAASG